MILTNVQTTADTAPFLVYAESIGLFLVVLAAFIGFCWLIDRYVITPRLRHHLRRALDRGDEQIRRAVNEHEMAVRARRNTVPKQLQGDR